MLKERTKMSDDMIEGLKSSRTFFTAEECLQHGIVDEIIDA
jgi:ATP-dependent protease ClpP protease subunit